MEDSIATYMMIFMPLMFGVALVMFFVRMCCYCSRREIVDADDLRINTDPDGRSIYVISVPAQGAGEDERENNANDDVFRPPPYTTLNFIDSPPPYSECTRKSDEFSVPRDEPPMYTLCSS